MKSNHSKFLYRGVIVSLLFITQLSYADNMHSNETSIKPFPASKMDGAYYLSRGNSAYHWAVSYVSAAIQFAAYSTHKKYGTRGVPLYIYDCSTSAGDTPPNRHP